MMIPKPGIMDTDPNQEWAMPDESTVENLYETTLEYYNLRPILKDMPAKTPRGPTPDAPAENALLSATMLAAMRGRRVLEVACGAGTVTVEVAGMADYILATDITPNTLKIARENITLHNVDFLQCDAFDLGPIKGNFNAGLVAGFFHVCPYSRHREFTTSLHSKLMPGSTVFMRSSRPNSPNAKSRLFRIAGHRDQYMRRHLSDGSEYVLVDNDYSKEELTRIFAPLSTNLEVHIGNYWWWIRYELPRR